VGFSDKKQLLFFLSSSEILFGNSQGGGKEYSEW
jgi:hypothetical protein